MPDPRITRRTALGLGLTTSAAVALAACTSPAAAPQRTAFVPPGAAVVRATERRRHSTGVVRSATLVAAEQQVDLAGRTVSTWSFGSVPASTIRMAAGDTLRAVLDNRLPAPTTVHWHGVAIRNDMDGVPLVTQPPVPSGARFAYEFVAEQPGTYWFHPHQGVQIDRGLMGALVVDDPKEPLRYDHEWVVVLDDWLDTTPEAVLQQLSKGMGSMGGMGGMLMRDGDRLMGTSSAPLGGDAGDVFYPSYLVNGRPVADPETFRAKPGDRVRIRLINAGGDTAFRVALSKHVLTITHADGFPVEPVEVDSVLIGMGERYDVLVTLGSGVFPFLASAEGKQARGFAVVRTAGGAAPAAPSSLPELDGRLGRAGLLRAATSVRLPSRAVDRTVRAVLTGDMSSYRWRIDGRTYSPSDPLAGALAVRSGERVGLDLVNRTTMWHPMHLHGHTYQHADGGPRKDTSIVLPGKTLHVELEADNPGRWALHCHNVYHAESGMMTVLAYQA